jgi:hypothetical protein
MVYKITVVCGKDTEFNDLTSIVIVDTDHIITNQKPTMVSHDDFGNLLLASYIHENAIAKAKTLFPNYAKYEVTKIEEICKKK